MIQAMSSYVMPLEDALSLAVMSLLVGAMGGCLLAVWMRG